MDERINIFYTNLKMSLTFSNMTFVHNQHYKFDISKMIALKCVFKRQNPRRCYRCITNHTYQYHIDGFSMVKYHNKTHLSLIFMAVESHIDYKASTSLSKTCGKNDELHTFKTT